MGVARLREGRVLIAKAGTLLAKANNLVSKMSDLLAKTSCLIAKMSKLIAKASNLIAKMSMQKRGYVGTQLPQGFEFQPAANVGNQPARIPSLVPAGAGGRRGPPNAPPGAHLASDNVNDVVIDNPSGYDINAGRSTTTN